MAWFSDDFKFKVQKISNGYLLYVDGYEPTYYRTRKQLIKDLSLAILEEDNN